MIRQQFKTLKEHAGAVTKAFRETVPMLKESDAEISLRGYATLRENQRYFIGLTARMMLAAMDTSRDSKEMSAWREGRGATSQLVTRIAVQVLCAQKSSTVVELAFRCQEFATANIVRKTLNHGVELGLLGRDAKDYALSASLCQELFRRSAVRLRDKDIIEYSEFCSAFETIERLQRDKPYPRDDDHPLTSPMTLSEALNEGVYDDDL